MFNSDIVPLVQRSGLFRLGGDRRHAYWVEPDVTRKKLPVVPSTEVPALPSISCRELMVPMTRVGSVVTADRFTLP
ncbi:hypothetical protein D3C76_1690060 [compost metagenome]